MDSSIDGIRDAVWKLIYDCGFSIFPADLNIIFEKLNISAHTYEEALCVIEECGLNENLDQQAFSAFLEGKWYIFYDGAIEDEERMCFALAHELGHIVLGHTFKSFKILPGLMPYTSLNDGKAHPVSQFNIEANLFAFFLLGPGLSIY